MRSTAIPRLIVIGLAALAVVSSNPAAQGAPCSQDRTINNPVPGQFDEFGHSVARMGDLLIVGAPKDDTGQPDSGVVYLIDPATGTRLLTINNPTPGNGDNFGWAVTGLFNTIIVGAPGDDTANPDAGAIYYFNGELRGTTSTPIRTITNPAGAMSANDEFGRSLSSDQFNNIIVGAPRADFNVSNPEAGRVYVYSRQTGALVSTIQNPDPDSFDMFGFSVAGFGDTIVVGAPFEDATMTDVGAAYQFSLAGTTRLATLARTLSNPNPGFFDEFGNAVAVGGGKVIVGAAKQDLNISNQDSGSVYVFDEATGADLLRINNPSPAANDRFGYSVACISDLIIVGAPFHDTASVTNRGEAYLFNSPVDGKGRTGGATTSTPLCTLSNTGNGFDDEFGRSVAGLSNGQVVVGSPRHDVNVSNPEAGRVYVFEGRFFVNSAQDWGIYE